MRASRVDAVLDPPGADIAGRYHRAGEAALYLTSEPDWAAIAVGRYLIDDDEPRLIVPLMLGSAVALDQRQGAACRKLGFDPDQSSARWNAMDTEAEPPSWRAADTAWAAGCDGLIDPSRGIMGGWHLVLFRWNAPGAPQVRVAGPPQPCDYDAARARWPAPAGWRDPREDKR